MQPFSLLVKPVGATCNLSCRYCFYRGHTTGQMSPALLQRMLESYAALPFAAKSVVLQGGEPTLCSPAIFDVMAQAPIARALQTNATRITDAFAENLAAHHWLVGASLDGPEPLNRERDGSFGDAVRGIRRLERAGVDYNLLTVVSAANVDHPAEVYRYLRDNFRTRYHQYIECTGPCEAIAGEDWGRFLIGLFDAWLPQDAHTVSIRLFDSIVSTLVRGYPTQCSFSDTCQHYLTVDWDGSVYPCDFYVVPEWRLGNVAEDSWERLLSSPVYRSFAARKRSHQPADCARCAYVNFCHGDCPRNRQSLCTGWKMFFEHALPDFRRLAAEACNMV